MGFSVINDLLIPIHTVPHSTFFAAAPSNSLVTFGEPNVGLSLYCAR